VVTFKRVQTPDVTINQIQDSIQDGLNQISSPFTSGNLLTTQLIVAGQDNLIAHKLGSKPQVWVLTDQNTNATVWSPVSSQLAGQSSSNLFLNLRASSTCTVSIWVS
jgi:hypothetical protein